MQKNTKGTFSLRLSYEDRAKLKKMGETQTRTLTNMIEHILKQEIARYEAEHGPIELSDEDLYEE